MKKFQLLGEFDCKIDSKGRMRVPAQIIKQLGDGGTHTFVVNRGLEKNLMLYPKEVWDKMIARIESLNQYDRKNRKFIRYMYRGASIVELDGSDRILIKKQLLEFGGIDKDVILFARGDQIEIWDTQEYNKTFGDESIEDFAELAEAVMRGTGKTLDDIADE